MPDDTDLDAFEQDLIAGFVLARSAAVRRNRLTLRGYQTLPVTITPHPQHPAG